VCDVYSIIICYYYAIRQNESELEKNKNNFSFPLYAPVSDIYYAEIPIKIKRMVPEIVI
tara:strand:+ start:441 stop:617 length:177 start_codon:yes stop_codon:yes gene_type:complete